VLQLTELGARLKEARIAKGYSLDDLQEITKIQKRYLVGIEEGNYTNMPGSFYVRAFIKQYAEAVNLNADELLEQYKRDIPGSQTEEVVQSYSTSHNRKKLASTKNKGLLEAMPKIIVGLFVVMILVVIFILVSTKMKESPDVDEPKYTEFEYVPPKNTENTTPVDGEEESDDSNDEGTETEEDTTTIPEITQTIAPGVVNGEDVVYEISNTDTLKVRVEVFQDSSWVSIRDEVHSEKIEARAYNAGEVVEYDSTQDGYARIRLGRALNVKVFVNEEEVPFASQGVTQNFILKLVKQEQ